MCDEHSERVKWNSINSGINCIRCNNKLERLDMAGLDRFCPISVSVNTFVYIQLTVLMLLTILVIYSTVTIIFICLDSIEDNFFFID